MLNKVTESCHKLDGLPLKIFSRCYGSLAKLAGVSFFLPRHSLPLSRTPSLELPLYSETHRCSSSLCMEHESFLQRGCGSIVGPHSELRTGSYDITCWLRALVFASPLSEQTAACHLTCLGSSDPTQGIDWLSSADGTSHAQLRLTDKPATWDGLLS